MACQSGNYKLIQFKKNWVAYVTLFFFLRLIKYNQTFTTMEKTFSILGTNYECRNFFDIVGTSTEISGVKVYRDGERIGSILGESLPDESDPESVENFKNMLEDWVIDNDN